MKGIEKVLVLGAGSAGLIAALALKKRNPGLMVRVLASKRIGTIGVGEGTVPYVVRFVHEYLGLDEAATYQSIDPVYKLGVRFTWGQRDSYDYTFSNFQHCGVVQGLSRPVGYYVEQTSRGFDLPSALMEQRRVAPLLADGRVDLPKPGQIVAWHLENHRLIAWLTKACEAAGVKFIEDEMQEALIDSDGSVSGVRIGNGAVLKADLFVDASGFRAELIGQVLNEPFESFADALYCDRAVVGGWDREDEEILPYTVSDSMDAGWAWQIDHPERINRGYVFSSDHLTFDQAEAEFRSRNPKLGEVREVKFRSGARSRAWVHNVVAIGNAAGFVEPLEATAIMCACLQSQWLADGILEASGQPTPSMRKLYNRLVGGLWLEIKNFLALHYRFNNRIDSEFWRRCQNEVPLGQAEELVVFYQENGPSPLCKSLVDPESPFGLPGYLAHLIGLKVPYQRKVNKPKSEQQIYQNLLNQLKNLADRGLTMEQLRPRLMQAETWQAMRN